MLVAGSSSSTSSTGADLREAADSADISELTTAIKPATAQRFFTSKWRPALIIAGLVLAVAFGARHLIRYTAVSGAGQTVASRAIAVLAFRGAPDDPEGDAVGRAVAADLASELARSPELRVISTQSSFQLDGLKTSLPEIGRRLHSRYIVDGTVLREGESLRLKIDLLDSEGGDVLWTASRPVDRTSLTSTERDLVSRVAGTLQSRMSRTEENRAVAQAPKSLDVFVLSAQAKAMMQRYNAEGIRESRRLLQQALAVDPGYALAWALLGITNTIDIGLHLTGEWNRSRGGEALAQVQHAISLQPDLPIAYVGLSDAQGVLGNFDAALAAGEHCHTLSPNDAACFYAIGSAQLRLGRARSALQNLEQALDRNPLPPANQLAFYGTALWADRRLEEALRVAGECLTKAPDFWRCRQDRIVALVELGRLPDARDEAMRLRAQFPGLTAEDFQLSFAVNDDTSELKRRRIAAAVLSGFPLSSSPVAIKPATDRPVSRAGPSKP